MAVGLNDLPRPVGNAVRYVRAGARLLRQTVIKKRRAVGIRFNHEPVGVAQPQPQVRQTRDSQLNHITGAETNTTSHVTSSLLTLSTTTSIGTSSSRNSTFDCREYEVDLVLSVALVGDKEQCAYDQAGVTTTTDNTLEPVQTDSQTQNDERLNNSGSNTSVAITIYNSLKSTKAKIDSFVKWYRRELERRNLI